MDMNTNVIVEPISIEQPIRLTMRSYTREECEFTVDIDNKGQLTLTPFSNTMEFVSADIVQEVSEEDTLRVEQAQFTEETSIFVLRASMLSENGDLDIQTFIDDIGQCIIYPTNPENMFISATMNDSLNLVTEEVSTETPSDNVFDEADITEETNTSDEEVPSVAAEVIEESVKHLTNNFEDEKGQLQCDTLDEQVACKSLLETYYSDIIVTEDLKVSYATRLAKHLSEDKDAVISCPQDT